MNGYWPETLNGKGRDNSFSPQNLLLLAALILSYLVARRLGLSLAFVHPVTQIWLPSGIALAAFILLGYRVWPAVLVGCFLGTLSQEGFVISSLIIPVGAFLEALAGAYLITKFAHGVKAFDTAEGVFLFVFFACICAPSISATIGIGINYLGGNFEPTDLGFRWLTWWLSHGIGILVVVPFLVSLIRSHRLDRREYGELIVLLVGLIFICLLVFGPLSVSLNKNQIVQVWLCVPFLLWAGFRFCPLEAAGTTLILCGSAIWGTLHGYGSFLSKSLTTSLILLDTFIGVIGTMTLVLAAMVVERRRTEGKLLETQSQLKEAQTLLQEAKSGSAESHRTPSF
jgi:integral membrane sensor domain MASE1